MDFVPQFLDLGVPSFLWLACHHSEKLSIQHLCKDQLVIGSLGGGLQGNQARNAELISQESKLYISYILQDIWNYLCIDLYRISIVSWNVLKSWKLKICCVKVKEVPNVTSSRVLAKYDVLSAAHSLLSSGGERESIMGNWRQNWGDFPTSPLP